MNSIFHLPLDKEVKTNNQQTPQDIKNKKDSRKQFTSIYMDFSTRGCSMDGISNSVIQTPPSLPQFFILGPFLILFLLLLQFQSCSVKEISFKCTVEIWFTNISLKIFDSLLIRDIGLFFYFLMVSLFYFEIKMILASSNEFRHLAISAFEEFKKNWY